VSLRAVVSDAGYCAPAVCCAPVDCLVTLPPR
jgi:hypothetical protein